MDFSTQQNNWIKRLEKKVYLKARPVIFCECEDPRIQDTIRRLIVIPNIKINLVGQEGKIRSILHQAEISSPKISIIDPALDIPGWETYCQSISDVLPFASVDSWHSLAAAIYLLKENPNAALVAGAVYKTSSLIKFALKILPLDKQRKITSSFFMIHPTLSMGDAGACLYADCAVIPLPTTQDRIEIVHNAIFRWRSLSAVPPRVALLSYQTQPQANSSSIESDKIKTSIMQKFPDVEIEGDLQFDAAFDSEILKVKAPKTLISGPFNIYIFPDLNSGNIAYKITERLSHTLALGPLLDGLPFVISDLSRGASSDVIYATALIAMVTE